MLVLMSPSIKQIALNIGLYCTGSSFAETWNFNCKALIALGTYFPFFPPSLLHQSFQLVFQISLFGKDVLKFTS